MAPAPNTASSPTAPAVTSASSAPAASNASAVATQSDASKTSPKPEPGDVPKIAFYQGLAKLCARNTDAVLIILEWLATMSDQRVQAGMLRISKQVAKRVWTVIYAHVHLGKNGGPRFLAALNRDGMYAVGARKAEERDYTTRLILRVQSVHLDDGVLSDAAFSIQDKIPRLTYISFCRSYPKIPDAVQPNIQHLSLMPTHRYTLPERFAFESGNFRSLTHLTYKMNWLRNNIETSAFATVPNLTHLALVYDIDRDRPQDAIPKLRQIFGDCPKLELLVCQIAGLRKIPETTKALGQIQDPRLVFTADCGNDFWPSVRGNKDGMWVKALAVSKMKWAMHNVKQCAKEVARKTAPAASDVSDEAPAVRDDAMDVDG